jgi:hypothetical protein
MCCAISLPAISRWPIRDGDILRDIANASALNMKGPNSILSCSRELSGGAAELLKKKCAESHVWLANLRRLALVTCGVKP